MITVWCNEQTQIYLVLIIRKIPGHLECVQPLCNLNTYVFIHPHSLALHIFVVVCAMHMLARARDVSLITE